MKSGRPELCFIVITVNRYNTSKLNGKHCSSGDIVLESSIDYQFNYIY